MAKSIAVAFKHTTRRSPSTLINWGFGSESSDCLTIDWHPPEQLQCLLELSKPQNWSLVSFT
jgi:hypothetical protein